MWATGSSRRPSGPRRQKWALGLSPLLYSQYQLFCCTICSAITHQRSGLHRTGSSNIHTNQGPVLTAVNIGPLLYTMQRGGGIGSACAGAVLGTALGQPVSSPSIQSILQRCCGIQRPESAFKNRKTAFPKHPPPKCQICSRIHTIFFLKLIPIFVEEC